MTGKPGNRECLKSILKTIQARIKMQTLIMQTGLKKQSKTKNWRLSLQMGPLQVAGGHRGTASPVRPDFCVLPLLSQVASKMGERRAGHPMVSPGPFALAVTAPSRARSLVSIRTCNTGSEARFKNTSCEGVKTLIKQCQIYLLIHVLFCLRWVFVAAYGLSLVAPGKGCFLVLVGRASHGDGFSGWGSTGSQSKQGSAVVIQGFSCSDMRNLRGPGMEPLFLHCQVDSFPLCKK